MSELWERHADWWQTNFTDGADVEYVEQILPLAVQLLAGYGEVLDLGTGEGQIARLLSAAGAHVVGIDPTNAQITLAATRGGDANYLIGDAAQLPFDNDAFDAVIASLVFEHIIDMEGAVAEVARVLRPGGRFALFLNHPLLQTPGSGWVDDYTIDDQYWRVGPYLVEQVLEEEVQKDVFIPFVHRPLGRYVNEMAAHGLLVHELHEPAPPASTGFQPWIPRLLVLVTQLGSAT